MAVESGPKLPVVPPDTARELRSTAVAANEASDAVDSLLSASENLAPRMVGLNSTVKSLEEAFSNFKKVVEDVGLQEATKRFYALFDSTTKLRQGFGDLEASSDGIKEKISLMNQAIMDTQRTLRDYSIESANSAREIAAINERLVQRTELENELKKSTVNAGDYNKKLADRKKIEEELSIIENKISKANRENDIAELYDLNQKKEKKQQILEDGLKLTAEEQKRLEIEQKLTGETTKDLERRKERLDTLRQEAEMAAAMMPLLSFEKDRLNALEKSGAAMDGFISKLTSGAERSNFFGSALFASFKGLDEANGGVGNLISKLGDGLTKSLLDPEKAFNRVANIINDRLIQSTLKFDQTLASVGKSTGGFRKEFESIAFTGNVVGEQTFRNLSQFGVTLEKYGQAYGSLSKTIGGFNNMLESQRKLLTDTAASLEVLGVSGETFGNIASKMMASAGKSAEGSRQAIETLAKDAIALGKSVSDYTRDFETAMGKISGYGREAISIFKELNAVSIATKGVITSQDLLSLSDRFKDFDSAAESVSKLNAVLGGTSVNILDMMKADPAEQIMMIKRAATESGLEFDKLNIGYKRLLAEYFGGDVSKAAAFFKADLQEAQSLMNKAAASEEELAKRKEQNVAFQDKLNALLDNMKVSLTPILELASGVAKAIQMIINIPGMPMIITFGLVTAAIYNAGMAIYRFGAGVADVAMKFKAKAAAAIEAAQAEVTAEQQATAAIERENLVIKENIGLQEQRKTLAMTTPAPVAGASAAPPVPGMTPPVVVPPTGTGGGIGGFLKGPGGIMLGGMVAGMVIGAGARAAASYVEKQNTIEREKIIAQMRREEIESETKLIQQMGIMGGQQDNKKIMDDLQSYINRTSQAGGIMPTGGEGQDILFITGDDGKSIKESYKLSTGDRLLPIGKEGGPLQQTFEPNTGQSINTFNEAKSVAVTNNAGGASIAKGDRNSVTNNVSNVQNQAIAQAGQNPQLPLAGGSTINLTAYLTIDNKKLDLITERVSEEVTRRS
jgi:hypothetical protein